jgi:hypothetical protein
MAPANEMCVTVLPGDVRSRVTHVLRIDTQWEHNAVHMHTHAHRRVDVVLADR